MSAPAVNTVDARGLAFACQPDCGFCCTAAPLVLPHERGPLGPLVVRSSDGTLRIPMQGVACGALQRDMTCGVYERRPTVCHLYPFQVHAGRRLQVTVSLGCPGVAAHAFGPHWPARHTVAPVDDTDELEGGAREAAARALAQPGAEEMARQAKATFAEFDRRMKEWEVHATPDQLRAAFVPHVRAFADVGTLPAIFAALEPGELVLGKKPAAAVEGLLHGEPEAELVDLLVEAARDAFDEPDTVIWVEAADYAWTRVGADAEGRVRLVRQREGAERPPLELDVADIPLAWENDATELLARYLERLTHRDQTEGAAAWLVDASGYQVTPAAAYGRVLAEAALQVILRAGLLAAEAHRESVDATFARRGIAAYETAYHSLPTLGSIL